MKKLLFIFMAIFLVFATSNPSYAVTFSGTATGEWTDVLSTDPGDVYSINNNDAGGEATFNWGIPATTAFDNQFTFDGVGSDGDPGWEVASETAFLIGDFSYRNGSTYYSGGIEGINLSIGLNITNPLGISDDYLFSFSITNTPNNTGDPVLDGDIVTVTGLFSDTTFSYDSIEYTLELLGFSSDLGSTIRTDFSSAEGATANAGVYAKITSNIPDPVPEPATMLLFSTGLAGLGVFRKKFKKV